ncbi:hypothetical protein [Gimesia maris]|uniref:hypothetical protein n=1 Tax=Gimesia maris TaxID=122 RepID=UPI0030DB4A9F|tara:strand:+ start:4977 stop:5255 length:279 start_codon:yes stop_codon:yes gene_type:complete
MTSDDWAYLLILGVVEIVIVSIFYCVFFYFVKRQLDKRLFLAATLSTLSGIVFMIIFAHGAISIIGAGTIILVYLPYLYYYLKGLPVQNDNS